MRIGVAALLAGILVVLHPVANAQKNNKEARQEERREERLEGIRRDLQESTDRVALRMRKGFNREPLINGYINALGQKLIPPDAPSDLKLSFRVIEATEPNAFALADGRIYITTGMIAFAENEAQLAAVLGHEIGHVTREHLVNSIYRQRYGKVATATKIAGTALGILSRGNKNSGAEDLTTIGVGLFSALTGARYAREQEKEADRVGLERALALGLDPAEAGKLWDKMYQRFGEPSSVMALFSGHPTHSKRGELVREVVSTDLALAREVAERAGPLQLGSASFSRLTSVVRRDSGIQMAELLDRYDLALEGLEAVLSVRPDDAKLLWAIGRIHNLTERPTGDSSLALQFLQRAAETDKRGLFPAIHRDLGYAYATSAEDFPKAVESLQAYVDGYIRKHGTYPPDLETIYDYMGLFGNSDWNAPGFPNENTQISLSHRSYTAPAWQTPGGATVEGSESFLREAYEVARKDQQQGAAGSE